MMIDVQYAWPNAEACFPTVRDWKEFNLFFSRPIQIDDRRLRRLHREAPMKIAAGEWQNTRHEFADLIPGLIDVAQLTSDASAASRRRGAWWKWRESAGA
jgi:L-alanine-DL-glutamate epimerase-like enolase superfamily enzyme